MAYEALRVAAVLPRDGLDTDDRTIPHEVGWIGAAVHLSKGCYRGQETVAHVANMGQAPRRLVLLHLDAGDEQLPVAGRAGHTWTVAWSAGSAPSCSTTSSGPSRWRW